MARTTVSMTWRDGRDSGGKVNTCEHEEGLNVETALRAAVKEAVENDKEVQAYIKSLGFSCFNWGDAMDWVPEETWAKHGIIWTGSDDSIQLDHDECLADTSDLEGDD